MTDELPATVEPERRAASPRSNGNTRLHLLAASHPSKMARLAGSDVGGRFFERFADALWLVSST